MKRTTWTVSMVTVMILTSVAWGQGAKPANPMTDTSVYPIAVWAMGGNTAKAFADMGVNIYVGESGDPEAWCSQIAEHGGVGFVHWAKYAKDEAKRRAIMANPGFAGWMHGDEPDNHDTIDGEYRATRIPPAKLIARYNEMKKSSTPAAMYLNLGQGLANGMGQSTPDATYREFMNCADIVCYDVYPTSTQANGQDRLHLVARGMSRLKAFAGPNRPAWIWLECTAIRGNAPGIGLRPPTPHELRAEVWMSILHGADGIGYFPHEMTPYRGGPAIIPADLQKEMKLTNGLLHKLAPVLRTGKKTLLKVDAADGRVDAVMWTLGGQTLIGVVNMKNADAKATLGLPDDAAKSFMTIGQNTRLSAKKLATTTAYKPYEVRLFWTGKQLTNQSYRYPEPVSAEVAVKPKPGNLDDLPLARDLRKGVYLSRTQHSIIAAMPLAGAPTIDGSLKDRAWINAETLGTWCDTGGTRTATHQTVGVVGRHGGKLYMAFRCVEPFPDEMVTNKTAGWQNDCIEIWLDPDNRRTSFAHIIVTADGRVEATRTVQDSWGEGKRDENWKPHIVAKTGRVKGGWTVELAIDIADVGDIKVHPVWGFDVARERKPAPGENSVWTSGGFNAAREFGQLTFAVTEGVTLSDGRLRNRSDKPVKVMVQVVVSAPEFGQLFPTWEDRWRTLAAEIVIYQLPPANSPSAGGRKVLDQDLMRKLPDGGRLRFTLFDEKSRAILWEEYIVHAHGGIKKK